MVTDGEGSLIKAVAGRLAWKNVWHYDDGGGATVFVLEAGPGRTLSLWDIGRLVESIAEILGPDREFFVEGIEEVAPDTWTKMTQL
ncbi:hypothetical protein NicSoilC12_32320 [Arthrobacter sp. NicSoilC12]|nr:hypothetical protein NicSoilC12_32320 [Arthrobacter sp. NicSoilC12]